ncbi:hypothetical protein [Wolbachia endosymbiont of Pentidionis agamae]|uniref:hypothetical protein n=1 Tax=Wolbachia endosymbiont of Pentidionis agamae TaxID=3110435 RepID=UPI002FD06A30
MHINSNVDQETLNDLNKIFNDSMNTYSKLSNNTANEENCNINHINYSITEDEHLIKRFFRLLKCADKIKVTIDNESEISIELFKDRVHEYFYAFRKGCSHEDLTIGQGDLNNDHQNKSYGISKSEHPDTYNKLKNITQNLLKRSYQLENCEFELSDKKEIKDLFKVPSGANYPEYHPHCSDEIAKTYLGRSLYKEVSVTTPGVFEPNQSQVSATTPRISGPHPQNNGSLLGSKIGLGIVFTALFVLCVFAAKKLRGPFQSCISTLCTSTKSGERGNDIELQAQENLITQNDTTPSDSAESVRIEPIRAKSCIIS